MLMANDTCSTQMNANGMTTHTIFIHENPNKSLDVFRYIYTLHPATLWPTMLLLWIVLPCVAINFALGNRTDELFSHFCLHLGGINENIT